MTGRDARDGVGRRAHPRGPRRLSRAFARLATRSSRTDRGRRGESRAFIPAARPTPPETAQKEKPHAQAGSRPRGGGAGDARPRGRVAPRPGPERREASSHREAPLISEDPSADNTDLYAFRSPDKPDTLTIVSNFIPGEDPAAGPNYYTFSPTARYDIYVDRNGDGKPDVSYYFQFKRKTGPFFLGDTVQPYTVTPRREREVDGRRAARRRRPTTSARARRRTTTRSPTKAVTPLAGGGQVFAGQRDDPFFADVGDIFDLLAIRKGTGTTGGGKDFLAGYAVHTIALQIPISQLDTASHTIGIWSAADRHRASVERQGRRGEWVQVSRLGNPLINEVVIPTGLKDLWNRIEPVAGRAVREVLQDADPRGGDQQALQAGRARRRTVTISCRCSSPGIPKVTFTGSTPADELRINLAVPVTPADKVSRLGVLGGDNQGWPNGRRLNDDVVDIAEQAVGGFLVGKKLPLGDGVNNGDTNPMASFPYVADPQSGADDTHGEQK